MLLEQLADELASRGLVSPALDQDLQHFAFIINRPPRVHLPAVDADHYFLKMPARIGLSAHREFSFELSTGRLV